MEFDRRLRRRRPGRLAAWRLAAWPITEKKSGRMALVDAGLKNLIEDHPTLLGAKIVPTPPPIKA